MLLGQIFGPLRAMAFPIVLLLSPKDPCPCLLPARELSTDHRHRLLVAIELKGLGRWVSGDSNRLEA